MIHIDLDCASHWNLDLGPCIHACEHPCALLHSVHVRYGQGRTRKRTPGSGTKGGKGKQDGNAWSMAMSAVQDLASVARAVVEGQKK